MIGRAVYLTATAAKTGQMAISRFRALWPPELPGFANEIFPL